MQRLAAARASLKRPANPSLQDLDQSLFGFEPVKNGSLAN